MKNGKSSVGKKTHHKNIYIHRLCKILGKMLWPLKRYLFSLWSGQEIFQELSIYYICMCFFPNRRLPSFKMSLLSFSSTTNTWHKSDFLKCNMKSNISKVKRSQNRLKQIICSLVCSQIVLKICLKSYTTLNHNEMVW